MPRYMLDTDISSYIMKRSNDAVLNRPRNLATDDVCLSAITKSELMYGVEVSPNRLRDQLAMDDFLRYVSVLDFPEGAALHYGQIRAALKGQGKPIGANDLFIAAHARSMGLILATNKVREFGRVASLRLENWTES